MQVGRDEIEAALPRKGFVRDSRKTNHRYFYHEYAGKRTGPYAYTSHGSKYKVYDDSLLKLLKIELRLDSTKQVVDLVKCPLTQNEYEELLRKKGILPPEAEHS